MITIFVMEFSDWITQKYVEWRGGRVGAGTSVAAFAALFGASQQLMSDWMKPVNRGGKIPESRKYIKALIDRYGLEAYDALGLPQPMHEENDQPPGFIEWMDMFLSADEEQREEMLEYVRKARQRGKKPAQNN